MTTWGGFNQHLRVGLDIWTDPIGHGTTAVTMYGQVSVQVDSTWNFNDAQTVHLYVNGGLDSTWNFQNTMGKNGTTTFLKTWTEYPSYGGGPSWTFSADVTGNYLGGTSTVSQGYTLPARPIAAPSAPGAPNAGGVTALHADFTWAYPADDGGSGADYTWLQIARDSGFGTLVYDNQNPGWSGRSLSIFAPGTTYWMRDAAHNAAGWSGWSGTSSFATNAYQLAPPSLTSVDPTKLHVTWGNPPTTDTATGWQVQTATDTAFTASLQTFTGTTWATSTDATGLTPGTNYYARVRANTANGYGAWSAAASLQTLSGAKVMRGGVWVDAPAYIYRNGAWVTATVYKNRAGTWNL
jgi:hypothetical protein